MDTMAEMAAPSPSGRACRRWLILAALLIPCVYLPTLATPFDFADDGCLAYPTPYLTFGERLELIWTRTIEEFRTVGPFRPVTWAFWEAEANLLPDAAGRRVFRLFWAMLSCGSLLWLFRELRVRPLAAVIAAAFAMWNPYRNEIWMAFGLTEAFAMPFALAGLACAVRGARSARPAGWDVAGALCVLVALGCKNTFAALVPAQMLLRIMGDGSSPSAGLRRHGWRAARLCVTLVFPAVHFVMYKTHAHQGYATHFSWAQTGLMVRSVRRALGLEFLVPALALMLPMIWLGYRQQRTAGGEARDRADPNTPLLVPAFLAGLALLVGGIAMYSVMSGAAGRYTMPAVWGGDLWLAMLFSLWLDLLPRLQGKALLRIAGCTLLAGGLVVVLAFNLGKQHDVASRSSLLWQALAEVERLASGSVRIAFLSSPRTDLNSPYLGLGEGTHFRWHLRNRGHANMDVVVCNIDPRPGEPADKLPVDADFAINSMPEPPPGNWQLLKHYSASYAAGIRTWNCYVWGKGQ